MLLLRSVIFTSLMIITVVFYAAALVICGPFISYRGRFIIAEGWCTLVYRMLKFFCKLDYRLEGREYIPENNCIVYMKHQSTWETLLTVILFPYQSWVLKRELQWIPFFGWALAMMHPIAIDRRAGHSAVQQVIDQGSKHLEEGFWIMIFPEGTRMPPGTTRRYGLSGAVLASKTGTPILPIALNAGDFWPRHSWIKKPGTITVRIGKPIETAGRDPVDINKEAQEWIEAQMREISVAYADGGKWLEKPRHLKT
ncbi:MAG: 1-acyl-sn-glycerol-3-phosphate acyltransferase [Gammaproteobacteria bacterium]|nr:1-acyl-sn-glycerol-3-phosphate acyltransferase [Gammaproteobacteria bacterium]